VQGNDGYLCLLELQTRCICKKVQLFILLDSLKKPRALLFGQKKVFDNGISIQRSMAPFDLGCCLGVISDA